MKAAIADPAKPLRTRLVLSADGDVHASTQPFEPLPPDKVWNLRIAHIRLDSGDPLLRHKTSRRDAYIKARADYQVHQADEVILLNERGEVCEGTITNIFARHRRRRAGHAGARLAACCQACCAASCSTLAAPGRRCSARPILRTPRRCLSAIRCAD